MPNKPKTKVKTIRIDDDLWREYGLACEDDDTDRTGDIRKFIERRVRAWRRRKNTSQ